MQAPYGTALYKKLKEAGRIIEHMTGDNVDGTTNIIPKMNLDALKEGYKNVLENIYSPKAYYERVKTFLREYEPPKIKVQINFGSIAENLHAFFRSNVRLGIFGKERVEYWKLLLWTIVRKPRSFPLAVRFAIYGHHFRRVCELHVL